MSEESRFYPFQAGPGASISEDEWADLALDWTADSGVRSGSRDNPANPFAAKTTGTAVEISPGTAKLRGFHYRLKKPVTIQCDPVTADGMERWDYAGIRLDMTTPDSGNRIYLALRKGAEAARGKALYPFPAQLWGSDTQTPGLYDLPVAAVLVQGTPTSPALVAVNDVRRLLPAGVRPVTGGTYPPAPAHGEAVFDCASQRMQVFDGSRWGVLASAGHPQRFPLRLAGWQGGIVQDGTGYLLRVSEHLAVVSGTITVTLADDPRAGHVTIPIETGGLYFSLPIPAAGDRQFLPALVFYGPSQPPDYVSTLGCQAFADPGSTRATLQIPDTTDSYPSGVELDYLTNTRLVHEGMRLCLHGLYFT